MSGVLIVLVDQHGLQSEHEARHSGSPSAACCCPLEFLLREGEVA